MILVNIDHIPGKDFDVIGIAEGNMIQTKHIGKDIMAGLKTLVGGELKGYTQMMNEARQMATKRMVESAQNMG
ncbi:MAG: heavy metal-binding domain-containing protein, partial [Clostridia bacterium]